MGITGTVGKRLAPRISQAAPGLTHGFVRTALERAINGVGSLPGAAKIAQRLLDEHQGDVDRAIRELIEMHVRYAGAQGFLTNLGGLVTAAVAIPANITGLALIQCRMVASIAWLRGYDLDGPAGPQRHPGHHPRRGRRREAGHASAGCRPRRWRWPPRRTTTRTSTAWSRARSPPS